MFWIQVLKNRRKSEICSPAEWYEKVKLLSTDYILLVFKDIKLCKKTGKPCDSKDDPDKPSCSGQCSKPKAIHMVFGDARWVKPTTVAELQTAISGAAGQKIRIMGANTGTGKPMFIVKITKIKKYNCTS